MFLLILYVVLAIGVSFLCSMMEATLLSITPSYVRGMVKDGRKSGVILEKFKENVDRPLSAILTLNTIANTIGAVGAGSQAQKLFQSPWVTVFAMGFTLAILIISEIIPKTLGAVHWRKLAPFCAYFLKVIVFILYPLVLFARWITGFLAPESEIKGAVYRQEIEMMAEIGEDEGALSPWEEDLIKNILSLSKTRVESIMTPRTVIFSIQENTTVGNLLKENPDLSFSRILLYDKNQDNMKGIALRADILDAVAQDRHETPLRELLRPIHAIPESISVARALENFIHRQEHIFLVIDEYGGTAGILAMEDCLEALLGREIVDERDKVADMQELALKKWKLRNWKMQMENGGSMEKKSDLSDSPTGNGSSAKTP